MRASIVKTIRTGAELYDTIVDLEYEGRRARIVVPRLVRIPKEAELRRDEDKLLLILRDDEGGIASCCLEPDSLEKGCLDVECPSAKVWVIPEKHMRHASG